MVLDYEFEENDMKRFTLLFTMALAFAACFACCPAWAAPSAIDGSTTMTVATTAADTAAVAESSIAVGTQAKKPRVLYRVQVSTQGWKAWAANGKAAKAKKRGLSIQGIRLKVAGAKGAIRYKTLVQGRGWEKSWRTDGMPSGASKNRALEAVRIQLTGDLAGQYDVYYRVYTAKSGWMHWARNGAKAGTVGLNRPVERIEVKLVAKGQAAPGRLAKAFRNKHGFIAGVPNSEVAVKYRAHVQSVGWQNYKYDGATAGTTGRGLQVEALQFSLGGAARGGISYRSLVQDVGWEEDWSSNGQVSGTQGQSLPIEAVQIELTGEAQEAFDVYYRVHASDVGWMGWASNGDKAGTSGYGHRVESLQVRFVPKGGDAPGSTEDAYLYRSSELGDRIAAIAVAEYESGAAAGDFHKGGKKYWSRFRKNYEAWCSEFAGWCMVEAGLVPGDTMPANPTYANAYVKFYRARPDLATVHPNDGTYLPQRGDIVIYVNGKGEPSHTEICVESCEDGRYADVSGNSGGGRVRYLEKPFPVGGVGYYISFND